MPKTEEELLREPCLIADVLPRQVPAGSPGQYFAIEEYYLSGARRNAVKDRHINLVLKLNCYKDVSLRGETNPPPERIAAIMRSEPVNLLLDDAMIASTPDDTYLTVFHPDDELTELLRTLCAGEGLYLWKP